MKKITTSILVITLLAIGGCAQRSWTRAGATTQQFEADKAQCEYQSALAIQTPSPGMMTIVGMEMDKQSRRNDLTVMCLKMKGYTEKFN